MYVNCLTYLKKRTTQLSFEARENWHFAIALNRLEGYKWYDDLLLTFRNKTLSWATIMSELSSHMAKAKQAGKLSGLIATEKTTKTTDMAIPTQSTANNSNNSNKKKKKTRASAKDRYPLTTSAASI